ncbi:hypothetical protein VTK73DRAFT_2052 [Phialemonium thermophilum]|uniref:Uncharacterized protein n=1 Tax=Phialemonium thermophilum TaxID=223376 RepID=A0ABR3VSP4_9PEZI
MTMGRPGDSSASTARRVRKRTPTSSRRLTNEKVRIANISRPDGSGITDFKHLLRLTKEERVLRLANNQLERDN